MEADKEHGTYPTGHLQISETCIKSALQDDFLQERTDAAQAGKTARIRHDSDSDTVPNTHTKSDSAGSYVSGPERISPAVVPETPQPHHSAGFKDSPAVTMKLQLNADHGPLSNFDPTSRLAQTCNKPRHPSDLKFTDDQNRRKQESTPGAGFGRPHAQETSSRLEAVRLSKIAKLTNMELEKGPFNPMSARNTYESYHDRPQPSTESSIATIGATASRPCIPLSHHVLNFLPAQIVASDECSVCGTCGTGETLKVLVNVPLKTWLEPTKPPVTMHKVLQRLERVEWESPPSHRMKRRTELSELSGQGKRLRKET
ncbi:hypothetical protein MW887_011598 [Aspergillus wentii]|nr:hypothetical protein MW887_011598 [Aspergillus wentii]